MSLPLRGPGVTCDCVHLKCCRDFPGGAAVKNQPDSAGDMGSSPGEEDPTCCGATKPVHHSY